MKKILLIDNYDSFTYNLAQYLGELGCELEVRRNDRISVDEARRLDFTHLVVSPGPGNPTQAGASNDLILAFAGRRPILGVCLGHQCIGHVFGGVVEKAERMMHGKLSKIYHDGRGVFRNLPNPFEATRYHSLVVREEGLPACLEVSAHTSEGEIMGLRHREFPIEGVQFHPESIMTRPGKTLLQNFLDLS
ncbi:MAG TPA: aminodeoxychorismate/anthranilate synthase component II [Planctomycetota bacterium]|nr:aminodeoxychorismate/anthranilate synthase component II [Planctomycetota bacterium]